MSLHSLTAALLFCWLMTAVRCSSEYAALWTHDDGETGPLSAACMRCISETTTGVSVPAGGALFNISYTYWAYAFGISGSEQRDEYNACVSSPWCAARTVQHNMRLFLPECVRRSPQRAPCETALALHTFGAQAACLRELDVGVRTRLRTCLDRQVQQWLTTNVN
uniref:lysozyme n=1 Tax=Phalera flavescens TaxID=13634 RepID=A0A090BTN3_PHAFA|nr:PFA lectin [Phalera flavescens]